MINVATDFSTTPGGRFKEEGPFSGEEFREKLLSPQYDEAVKSNSILEINMDGCFGFAPSFIEEAFGGLAREKKSTVIMKNIIIICNDEPSIKERINNYVKNALNKRRQDA